MKNLNIFFEDAEFKRMLILKDAFGISDKVILGNNVLLFDDLYRSGATLKAISRLLLKESNIKNLYVLNLTMTRSIR